MSTLAVKGNWNIVKGKFRQTFARLMDDEVEFIEGKETELTGRIQKRSEEISRGAVPAEKWCSGCNH